MFLLCIEMRLLNKGLVDTGSTYSLIRYSLWEKLKAPREVWKPSGGQTFSLASRAVQSALGMIEWDCSFHDHELNLKLYVLDNRDLAFPLVLGMDFLHSAGVTINFQQSSYQLPAV